MSRETDQYGLSDRVTASLCTVLLRDTSFLIEMDHAMINRQKDHATDKNKVRRERQAY